MATRIIPGHTRWSLSRDSEGHREYKLTMLVLGASTDGPATVLQTAGLPRVGSTWAVDGDIDQWAWCRPDATVTPKITDEPNRHWTVEFTFSTKPTKRCQDTTIENPLLEPAKISGGFSRFNEEATTDRLGKPIQNTALEQIRGPTVEFDGSRPTVKIEQNVANLQLGLFAAMIDTVNTSPLWGMPDRTVKLMSATWERKYYGQCTAYYTRTFEFEIRAGGFDRDILDEGTKVLRGDWDRDEFSSTYGIYIPEKNLKISEPASYMKFKDWNGENTRVILDGHGTPYNPADDGGISNVDELFPVTVVNGGGGYDVGDILKLDTGVYSVPAKFVVQETLGGVVRVLGLSQGGVYLDFDLGALPTVKETGAGAGCTVTVVWNTDKKPGSIHVEKYAESNFLLLGIPLTL